MPVIRSWSDQKLNCRLTPKIPLTIKTNKKILVLIKNGFDKEGRYFLFVLARIIYIPNAISINT